MKSKKFMRKLQLNRETVTRLDQDEKQKVLGGKTATPSVCLTYCGQTDCGIKCPCEWPYTY